MSYFPFYLLLICQSLNFELFLCRYKTYNGTNILIFVYILIYSYILFLCFNIFYTA
nr:MAG TPA: hypothetical protein [Caudoviricetes sp.]